MDVRFVVGIRASDLKLRVMHRRERRVGRAAAIRRHVPQHRCPAGAAGRFRAEMDLETVLRPFGIGQIRDGLTEIEPIRVTRIARDPQGVILLRVH